MKKTVIALCVILVCALTPITAYGADDIRVYVNGAEVDFGENKPVIKNSRTLAPARDVFGSVGAEIAWDAVYKKVSVTLGGKTIELKIGKKQATYSTSEGSKQLTADVAPEIINSSTYVPLSIIAEALGAEVKWDGEERAAYFTFDAKTAGQLETPEETKIAEMPEAAEKPGGAEKPQAAEGPVEPGRYNIPGLPLEIEISGTRASIGDSSEAAGIKLGRYSKQSASVYGYLWQELNNGRDIYALLGSDSGVITALYSNSRKVTIAGITPGMSAAQLKRAVGAELLDEKKSIIETGEGRITVYRSAIDDYSVIAVMAQKTGHTAIAVRKVQNDYFTEGTERQLADIINTERMNNGLTVLQRDSALSKAARSHSVSMAQGNFLSSEDKSGKTAFDRMNENNVADYEMASENIGRDVMDAIEIYYEWMNDRSYAANILDEHYNYFGVGVAPCPNDHKMYFTVDFIER